MGVPLITPIGNQLNQIKMKFYFHVIEDANYGNIAHRGYYKTEEEAQKEVDRLSDFFPEISFYVFPDTSKKEPYFITL
jgi:hypothetical protein